MARYFVDERIGCIAVRDRTKTDPNYKGLESTTEGVVSFKMGILVKQICPECGHSTSRHEIPEEIRESMIQLCNLLNKMEG